MPLWIENEIRYYGASPMRFSCGNDECGCEREMEQYNGVGEGEPWWTGGVCAPSEMLGSDC